MTDRQYKIRFNKARQKRGLPCYAVMRLERDRDGTFWMGLSSYHTEEEAKAELAKLEGQSQP